jgi:hypothetical protein
VVANTQEWLDEHLAQWIELGAIVGDPPVAWIGPLSIDLALSGEFLDRKYAALAAQASQTEALRAEIGEERYREIIRVERFATFEFEKASVAQGQTDGTKQGSFVTHE